MTHDLPPRVVARSGRTRPCPRCHQSIRYTTLTNWNRPTPFFYCTACNNVLLRQSDERVVAPVLYPNLQPPEVLETLWQNIVQAAPPCPCGGRFALWSNIKCPCCHWEFPYNGGLRSAAVRLYEPTIIVIDGALVLGDTASASWVARVHPKV